METAFGETIMLENPLKTWHRGCCGDERFENRGADHFVRWLIAGNATICGMESESSIDVRQRLPNSELK
ncbi:MAG TPA: hypothetical protein DHV61_07150 [Glutamicibacter sp.]|nr:hypothetical protein [Glutamicibacter sp.]